MVVSHIEKCTQNCHGPGSLYIKEMIYTGKKEGGRDCCHSASSAGHRQCSVSQGMGAKALLLPSAPNSLQGASHLLTPNLETFRFTM